MAITPPTSDLSRSIQHEPSHSWPYSVKIQIKWLDKEGRPIIRSHEISANEFFGIETHGAPISGDQLIAYIERMRRAGPPKVSRRIKPLETIKTTR
jgi:hypothetical protein